MRARSFACLVFAPLFLLACAADEGDAPTGDETSQSVSAACVAQPACNGATSPQLGAKRPFTHAIVSNVITAVSSAAHRGHDEILAVGEPQFVIGKFSYGAIDKDLHDEEVDIFVERGCGGAWEKLGTTRTTKDGEHAAIDGVADSGGRIFFEIPKANELAVGRHRLRLVVAGDQTSTDLIMEIVPKGTPIVVSDVDGTLTSSELAEFPAGLVGVLPGAQPDAAAVLTALAAKGYHVVYLTARAEQLTHRTHEFLDTKGFPRGVVHTTTGLTGALGGGAATFKSAELAGLAAHGHKIEFGFGNKPSDTDAYAAAGIPLAHRVFLKLDDTHGGRRIEGYADVLPTVAALPAACK